MTVPEIGTQSIAIHIMNLEYFLKSVFQYEFTLNIMNVHSSNAHTVQQKSILQWSTYNSSHNGKWNTVTYEGSQE